MILSNELPRKNSHFHKKKLFGLVPDYGVLYLPDSLELEFIVIRLI